VVSQTGELRRLVDWAASAYDEIQNRHTNWRWMRSRFTLSATVGDDEYPYTAATDALTALTISRFARWWPLDDQGYNAMKIYLTSAGVGTENWLRFIPYASFRNIYKIGTQTNGYPAFVTIDPQNNILLGPAPDGTYSVSGEYQRGPQSLTADADEPDMPAKYHLLIVYRAMMKYGRFKSAAEVLNGGKYEGDRLMRQLEAEQLPAMALAGPLA
jgi:hypothetical protein